MSTWEKVFPEIKLVVGLGNIGEKYQLTRHNAGFVFADYLCEKYQGQSWHNEPKFKAWLSEITLNTHKVYLAKPTTLMNSSGEAVSALLKYFQLEPNEVVVAHDDMDIKLGKYKLQWANGPRVHNGISSVNKYLGTEDYWRLRIGIENRPQLGNKGIPGMRFALERFRPEELNIINQVCHEITANN